MALFAKKKPLESGSTPVQALLTKAGTNPAPAKGDLPMSKPSSYFSVQDYTFKTKGRKGNPDTESTEKALFFEKEIFVVTYKPMATVPAKEKYVREAGLKEIAAILEEGYDENITSIILKDRGYKELVQTLKDHKILTLDFCQFVKDEVAKIPAKVRKSKGKDKKRSARNPLVSILAGLFPGQSPEQLGQSLRVVVSDDGILSEAMEILQEKLDENGRDEQGYIKLRIRNKDAAK